MTAKPVPFEVEEFWDDLLAFIEERRVIPVVGGELLTINLEGRTLPLYGAVAERLLRRYGVAAPPRDPCALNDAVSALVARGKRVRDLYRPVHDILQQLLTESSEAPQPLRQLAAITHFDLFVSTTPDGLMARALNATRFHGVPQTDEIEYAPKLPTGRRRDIPEAASSGYAAVFYLFGKADVAPFYAIHDEDALEFAYMLQAGSGPERMFSQMRSRNLLLIGCTFGDWLSRFFLRLSNTDRLSSDQRTKREYLVGSETTRDENLIVFLERFSQDTRCYQTDAPKFAADLYQRWLDRNPAPERPSEEGSSESSATSGTIFISYASRDLGAARVLYDELQKISGDVAWFDKAALKPGDPWERQILAAIQKCGLFLPLISTNTERRDEGFFRREWTEAEERSKRIEGRKFVVPIVIDPDYGGDMSSYQLLPDRFRSYQHGHAPAGRMDDALRDEIQRQLRQLRRGRTS